MQRVTIIYAHMFLFTFSETFWMKLTWLEKSFNQAIRKPMLALVRGKVQLWKPMLALVTIIYARSLVRGKPPHE